jgi:hypothetical protein
MALLPKNVLFKDEGINFALQTTHNALSQGINPITIQHPNPNVQFCTEVETVLKKNFPIKSITGTANRITVTFEAFKNGVRR